MRKLSFVALLLVVLGALVALPAYGTSPGKNGLIAFTEQDRHLWVIDADGNGMRKLTATKGRVHDVNPDWSPDGSKVAFERCTSGCAVWTVSAAGTGLKRLNPGCGPDCGQPAWSPNGKELAVARAWGGTANDQPKFVEIFVMDATGRGLRQVTRLTTSNPFSASIEHPVWAPNGKQLVFEVHNSPTGEPASRRALFIINADGSEQRQLTPWSLNGSDPDWSPDGKLILFRSVPGREQHGNLFTINADGSDLKQLTRYPTPKAVFSGSFSPDGKWITLSRFTSYYPAVFIMRVNGSGMRQVSNDRGDMDADWGPAR